MIFAILLTVLIEIFDAFAYFVFPLIPSSVLTVIDSIFTYLTSALNWVFAFIDKTYTMTLISWWIAFGAVVLTYELLYSLWQLITGNGHNSRAALETLGDSNVVSVTDSAARTFNSKH